MRTEITTSTQINASPEKVWSILLDFNNYTNWNPFITSITGVPKKGEKLHVQINSMHFSPIILEYDINKELEWKGKLLFNGLFDGKHQFLLEDNKDGTTTFIHSEKFFGILVPLFSKKINTEVRNGFISMNKALKEIAERV
ncbi:SRPBCC domain-containing protein [uncultured Tenacibaculum sp.]|uniref:SRPBCC domain-containing protein n=1 Tax=uncultured Tenacibaculum sp. TaxID=174713 RepID=UPI00261B5CAC|nr:SRPBCC domain-containing protein [uncultured Tenacibaculum sp.]